jgi:hypothetical protein
MKNKFLLIPLLTACTCSIVGTYISLNVSKHENSNLSNLTNSPRTAININTIFTGSLDMGGYREINKPKNNDIIGFLFNMVRGTANEAVINDLVIGSPTTLAGTVTTPVSANSAEYIGSINVTYQITDRINLENLEQKNVDITGLSTTPTYSQILNRLQDLNSALDINQLDFNSDATKTIVENQAYVYELVPRTGYSYYSGSCKLIVYKTGVTIPIEQLIQNKYLSIFTGTPGSNEPSDTEIKTTIKF